jgi:hypothetical protein
METKLVFERNCEIYFYFGIYSIDDTKLIAPLLKFFYQDLYFKHFHPECNFDKLSDILNLYEKNLIQKDNVEIKPTTKQDEKDDFGSESVKENKKIDFYKKLLKEYNIGLNIDEIVAMISSEKSLKHKLDGITLKDSKNLKQQCSLIVFLITKKYLNSELFENHWKEANETKKDIVIFLLEQDLELNQDQFMNYKVLNIIDFMKKLNSSFKYSEWRREKMSDDEIVFLNFIRNLYVRFPVSNSENS